MHLNSLKNKTALDIDAIVARANKAAISHENVNAVIQELADIVNMLADMIPEAPETPVKPEPDGPSILPIEEAPKTKTKKKK